MMKLITYIDNIGRTIVAEDVTPEFEVGSDTVKIQNPTALTVVGVLPDGNVLDEMMIPSLPPEIQGKVKRSIVLKPIFFKELLEDSSVDVTWYINKSQVTLSDAVLSDRTKTLYLHGIGELENEADESDEVTEGTVIKLFDEETE